MSASLESVIVGGTTSADAILPSIGVVARGYVVPGIAVNFELSGLCALHTKTGDFALRCTRDADPDFQANYFNWKHLRHGQPQRLRRRANRLAPQHDAPRHQPRQGRLKFQGMWFGGVVRY